RAYGMLCETYEICEGDMAIDPEAPIGELALVMPGGAALFEKLGLDFCGTGKVSLAAACGGAGLPLEDVVASLEEASRSAANVAAFRDWRAERPTAVAHHIVDHNFPVERETMADMAQLIAKVASVHGARHPELFEINALWADLCERLAKLLREESRALEPFLEEPTAPKSGPSLFTDQHEEVVTLAHRIRVLTHGYAPPADACDAFLALYRELAAFEADLHEHVLLADNVLFVDPP
ncbi:MAG TPA: DUF542 domain-containing protein, partial [Polyangiaceae bacterium]